jgi:hypothetical protein
VFDPRWAALPLAGYLLAVLLAPLVRRSIRRRTGSARSRCLGAWHDILDELAYPPAALAGPTWLRTATPAGTRDYRRPASEARRHRAAAVRQIPACGRTGSSAGSV